MGEKTTSPPCYVHKVWKVDSSLFLPPITFSTLLSTAWKFKPRIGIHLLIFKAVQPDIQTFSTVMNFIHTRHNSAGLNSKKYPTKQYIFLAI